MDTIFTEGGRMVKMEVDYSETVNEKLPHCEKLAQEGKFNEALEILLSLEKQTRTGADTHSTSRVLVAIVKLCFENHKYEVLDEQIVALSKRRGQIKQAIQKMVEECCKYVDLIKDKTIQFKYIETLRSVTAGKIYVEVERARLTLKLAHMKEKENKIDEAANILQELQVETYASMQRKEKTALILEQIRLCLAKKDYIRTQIISKKINTSFFNSDDPEILELKNKYYSLMIELDKANDSYLNVCRHYMAIYNTKPANDDESEAAKKQLLEKQCTLLKNAVVYIILSPYDNEQSDLMHRIEKEKKLHEIPHYLEIIKLFTTWELINWSVWETSGAQILRNGNKTNPLEVEPTGIFSYNEEGNKKWKDLKNRVVEHNIRVMAKYYRKITLKRMAHLLGLTDEETEEALSTLVVSKTVYAKIDRSIGIVNFEASKDPNEVLNDWSSNIDSLMNSVGKLNHLINKEEMIHQNYGDMLVSSSSTTVNVKSSTTTTTG